MVVALGAAGCMPAGEPTLAAELARVRALESVVLLGAEEERAAFQVGGQSVTVMAAEGFCISPETIEADGDAAFLMLSECLPIVPAFELGVLEPVPLRKDRAVSRPSLMTISLSAEPLVEPALGRQAALSELGDFLRSAQGRRMLARHGEGDDIEIRDMRRIGDALYVQVTEPEGLGFFAPDYWRAFLEVRGRPVLVTISGLAGRMPEPDQMLGLLALQVTQLRTANGAPVVDQELTLAAATDRRLRLGPASAIARAPAASGQPSQFSRWQSPGERLGGLARGGATVGAGGPAVGSFEVDAWPQSGQP
ncbi:MAG: hypothetical protein AAF713_03865 [Pseudomonadota bacterium]